MSIHLILSVLLLVVALPANTEAQSLPTVFVPPPTHASASVAHAAYVPPTEGAPTERAPTEREAPRRGRLLTKAFLIAGPLLVVGPSLLNGLVGLFAGFEFHIGYSGPPEPEDPRTVTFRWVSFVPLAGPWIQLGIMGPSTFGRDAWGLWFVADGLLQATGLALLIAGLVLSAESEAEEPDVIVLPTASSDGAGLMVRGRF